MNEPKVGTLPRIRRLLARLLAVAVLTGTPSVLQLRAQECSNATFQGSYGLSNVGTSKLSPSGEGDFHVIGLGMIAADGMGQISDLKQTIAADTASPPAPGGFVVNPPLDLGKTPLKIEYTVNPDCTGFLEAIAPDGHVAFSAIFVLVQGGQEGWLINTSGPAVTLFNIKRVDDRDRATLEQVAADITEIKADMERLLIKNGLVP